jgi:hypothetical protein
MKRSKFTDRSRHDTDDVLYRLSRGLHLRLLDKRVTIGGVTLEQMAKTTRS